MDNLKCLFDHVSAHASADFIDVCETLRKELLKSRTNTNTKGNIRPTSTCLDPLKTQLD